MTYRILPAAEWYKLGPIMERQGKPVPRQEVSMAAVAEDFNGQIVAVLFLQTALHLEPLVIENPRVYMLSLLHTMDEALAEKQGLSYYCFTEGEKMARVAEIGGFKRLGDFWVREVTNGIPQS